MAELSFDLVKAGFAEPGGDISDDTGYCASDGVLSIFSANNTLYAVNTRLRIEDESIPWSCARPSQGEDTL